MDKLPLALLAVCLTLSLALNVVLFLYSGEMREELEKERRLPWKRQ